MIKNIFAYTNQGKPMVGYIAINQYILDGEIAITVRNEDGVTATIVIPRDELMKLGSAIFSFDGVE